MSEQLKTDSSPIDESGAAGQPAADPPSSPNAPDADTLESLRRDKDALQERLLRTAAEYDNYRKRVDRERRELAEFASSDVLAEILPIIDNLERALQAPAGGEDAFRKGVEMIHKQM